jgi:hypothetical protein
MGKPKNTRQLIPAPLTSEQIKHLAGEGLARPSKLTAAQVRELAGSVMAHIKPRVNAAPFPKRASPNPKQTKRLKFD